MTGDFIGFSFNGHSSSDLGIIRTSNGSRFDENLLPTIQDKAVQVPGDHGTYYFDSFYTQKQFNIPIAFDSLTEAGIRKLREVFGENKIGRLIFEELPYKYYMVKCTGTPQIKFICFDKKKNNQVTRIYKGEGTLQFVAYYPFARSVHKYLNEYDEGTYKNKNEWISSSRFLSEKGLYDGTGTTIKIYNPGDFEADWSAIYTFDQSTSPYQIGLTSINIDNLAGLNFNTIKGKGTDTHIRINSDSNLIEGGVYSNGVFTPSGNLYNEYIASGDFFKIQKHTNTTDYSEFKSTGASCNFLEYEYIFF